MPSSFLNTHRVWVTRDEEPGGELSSALEAVGLQPVLEPVLTRRIVADAAALLKDLGPQDWLVVTSPLAARAMDGLTTPAPPPPHVAAVGESTARELHARGLRVDLTSPDSTGASLWAALWPKVAPGATVCYPRSSLAEAPTPPAGVRLQSPVLYRTEPREFDLRVVGEVAVVTLASPSAVEQVAGIPGLPPCASIGPTTSAAMHRHGIPVWVESAAHTFGDLAATIAARLRTPGRP